MTQLLTHSPDAPPDPVDAAVTIRSALTSEYDVVGAVTRAGFDRRPTTDPARLALLLDARGRAAQGDLLVATIGDGTIVGTASLLRAGEPYARLAEPGEAEVRLLAVLAPHRRFGFGAALLQESIRRAREWGAERLVLDTGGDNWVSQRVYHRLGFERVPGRERRVGATGTRLAAFAYQLRPEPGVLIHLVRPDQYEQVADLTESAYAHDYTISDEYRASLRDVASRAQEHEVWVAVDRLDGELLGALVTPRPGGHVSPLAVDGELDLRLLAVHPRARRRGVATALVAHVVQLATLRGAHRVVLNSGPRMTPAHQLYEALGFTRLTERETRVVQGGRLRAYGLDVPPRVAPAS